MSIVFVLGMACVGKSTYIKKNYPNHIVVDLYDFQRNCMTVQDVIESYNNSKVAFIEALKSGADVVLEHTLFKKIRRLDFIDSARSITDAPIECVVIMPSAETILENAKKRGVKTSLEVIEDTLSDIEMPDISEGFSSVTVVSSFDL